MTANTIIDAAVHRMLRERKPFNGRHYESSFTSGFSRFCEAIACASAHRIYRSFFDNGNTLSELGNLIRLNSPPIKGEKGATNFNISTGTNADWEPRFSILVTRTPADAEDEPLRGQLSLAVHESIPTSGGSHYQKTIMEADIVYSSKYTIGTGTLLHDDFHSFITFSETIKNTFPIEWAREENEEKFILDTPYRALLDADGGLPGAITVSAVEAYFATTAREISKWAATIIPDIASNQNDRGFIWGEQYLNFNDLDDSCCAIASSIPGRSAVFHENTSLINPYRAYLAWVDTTENGNAHSLSVRMISADETIGSVMDAFQRDEITPTLLVDFSSNNLITAANFHDTDLLHTFSFHLAVDEKMFVQGQMDDSRDCDVHTDFSDYYADNEDEFTTPVESITP